LEESPVEEVVSEEVVVETPSEEVAVEETKEQAPIVETPIEQPQAKEEIVETPPSEVVSEEVITPKEEVGEVEEVEVYHGGKYDEKSGNVYVTEDKNQANEYTKGNDGDLIKYSIGKSKIASEDVFRQAIEEEGISIDEELKLYELIDDRFETALSEEERSKIFDNLKKKGFEAASFIDEDITGRNKLGVTNMVVFDAATLGKKSVEVKESKAYELLGNGYKPIINGEIKDDFTEENIGDYFKSNKRIEMVSPSSQQAMGVVSKDTKQTVPALMDVNSTTKAFDKLQNENSKEFSDVEDMIIESTQIVGKYNNKDLSEAYHKAKKDGSNPELVKAVEDLLSTNKQTTLSKEQAKEVVSEEVKQETPKKEVVKEQDIETKVKELTEKRDVEIVKASKPSLKLDWVSVKDIAQLPSEISKDKKEEQAKIKTKYKELLKIMDCL
jgi:hypothetical protein